MFYQKNIFCNNTQLTLISTSCMRRTYIWGFQNWLHETFGIEYSLRVQSPRWMRYCRERIEEAINNLLLRLFIHTLMTCRFSFQELWYSLGFIKVNCSWLGGSRVGLKNLTHGAQWCNQIWISWFFVQKYVGDELGFLTVLFVCQVVLKERN